MHYLNFYFFNVRKMKSSSEYFFNFIEAFGKNLHQKSHISKYSSAITCNLVAENRNTVFSRKYFQTPELLNFPFNWGLEITRIFVFYLHLKLVESANWGLNFFCFVCDRCSKFIEHQWPHVLWRKGFYFYERGV